MSDFGFYNCDTCNKIYSYAPECAGESCNEKLCWKHLNLYECTDCKSEFCNRCYVHKSLKCATCFTGDKGIKYTKFHQDRSKWLDNIKKNNAKYKKQLEDLYEILDKFTKLYNESYSKWSSSDCNDLKLKIVIKWNDIAKTRNKLMELNKLKELNFSDYKSKNNEQ